MNAKMLIHWTVAALFLAICTPSQATAATITVDTGGLCTLADAITAANTNAITGNCAAGSGDDTIKLEQDVVLTAALPIITSTILIEGAGKKIDGQNNETVGSVLRVASSGVLTLNATTVTGGKAVADGGGIYNDGGSVRLTSSTVSGNATGEFGFGGGIYNSGGTVTLEDSSISTNWAYNDGGGIHNLNGTVTLTNSTVDDNVAGYYGGGIENYKGTLNPDNATLTLNNSTVSGNEATYSGGGGIDNYNGTATLTNTTISENATEYGGGGGIEMLDGTLTLRSCIVSGNTAGMEVYLASGTLTANSYNVFGESSESKAEAFEGFLPGAKDITATSDGNKPTALRRILSPLAMNNDSSVKTHALPAHSPAVNLDKQCITGLGKDQRGVNRPIGEGCDAGAFEGIPPRAMSWIQMLLQ